MTSSAIRYEMDAEGIVTLVLDDSDQSANTLNVATGGRWATP